MTKRNRKETVEQEKPQTEEITKLKMEPESNSNAQDEIINSVKNGKDLSIDDTQSESQTESASPTEESPLKIFEDKLAEMNDKYLRLSAEFDNYRKRTMRERADLIKSAGEDILSNILPVLDNFERALLAINDSRDPEAIKEGIVLIYSKFRDFLFQRGIKEIDTLNTPFDAELHDAITKIPVAFKEQQGMVIDVVEKGYYLNDKIIRHSKVVVGEYNEPGTSGASSENE
jgi:molecular chaperone GrpE